MIPFIKYISFLSKILKSPSKINYTCKYMKIIVDRLYNDRMNSANKCKDFSFILLLSNSLTS